jgi:hypothetical protein
LQQEIVRVQDAGNPSVLELERLAVQRFETDR